MAKRRPLVEFGGILYEIPTNDSLGVESIDLTLVTAPANSEGRVFYDIVEKTLAYYNEISGITVNIYGENRPVYNATGSTILNGQAVYINGANVGSGLPTVALAKADSETTALCIGICTADIPNNTRGYIAIRDTIHGLNTSSFASGATVYLSATTAGAITTTKPLAPNYAVRIGTVSIVSASNGSIALNPGGVPSRKVEVYVDDVLQTGQVDKRWYNLTIAGGAGAATKFLTSDGLTKGAGNTFLYTTVFGGGGAGKVLQGLTENPVSGPFNYNTGTGLATWIFEESNTSAVLIGGTTEGLEFEENGTTVWVWVEGVR